MPNSCRVSRQPNANMHDNETKEQPAFFSKADERSPAKGNKPAFFQANLSVGQPNDVYEREADEVANAIVNRRPGAIPLIQQKRISSIQRLATPIEEEKFSTNDERMKHDKDIQEKPEVQRMSSESGKEEEEEGVIQSMNEGGGNATPQLSSGIEKSAGKGNKLPRNVLSEMNQSFGADFNNVHIHTDSEAVRMSKELGAQAFTHGNDIYFNNGKYNTDTTDGKFLLAHELTHVVQQGFAPEGKRVQRQLFDDIFDFNPFKETEIMEGEGAGGNPQTNTEAMDPFGGLLGNFTPIPLALPAWKTDFLSITLISPNATCIGSARPGGRTPMSLCNASHFCSIPAQFVFNLFFHFDVDVIPRPTPFSDADVSVGMDFIPDGETAPTFSRHQSGKGVYKGAGDPLTTPFGTNFSFSTNKSGTLFVFAQMVDSSSGITVTYIDNIRCTIIPCV